MVFDNENHHETKSTNGCYDPSSPTAPNLASPVRALPFGGFGLKRLGCK